MESESAALGRHVSRQAGSAVSLLVCRAGGRFIALPIQAVIETMRPLPIDPIPGAPQYVLGVSVIRGIPVPVLDMPALVTGSPTQAGRFVTIRPDHGDSARSVALAVDDVAGLRQLETTDLTAVPGLLTEMDHGIVSALGQLDDQLLLVLSHTRLLPEQAWAALALDQPAPAELEPPACATEPEAAR